MAPVNGDDLTAASWDDLNVPARLPTLLAGGVPLIARPHRDGAVGAGCSA